MAYIYKIVNKINGKMYIGQTKFTPAKRWAEHCYEYKRKRVENRPLYIAMKKYGIHNFYIETIEQCEDKIGFEREKYWINKLNTFVNGYNATFGGAGKSYVNYAIIVETYLRVKNQKETARILDIDVGTVNTALKLNNIKIFPKSISNNQSLGVNMLSLNGDLIKAYCSLREAAFSLKGTDKNIQGVGAHISDVCKGKRKTAYGYKWQFAI